MDTNIRMKTNKGFPRGEVIKETAIAEAHAKCCVSQAMRACDALHWAV